MKIIGRDLEQKNLKDYLNSKKSEFIVVYGRRRVGKTFLIRNTLENKYSFYTSGMSEGDMKVQIGNFHASLLQYSGELVLPHSPQNWRNVFDNLIHYLENCKDKIKTIFIDEIPWLDTPRAGFISALEYFWNQWASARDDIKLIVCGSSSLWIIDKLVRNKKGLYNRVTKK